jgi:hypothetical protein
MRLGFDHRARCAQRKGGRKGKMEEPDWFGFFDRIEKISE